MCFASSDIKEKIATEPIICYKAGFKKVFGLVFRSYFHRYFYIKGIKPRKIRLRPEFRKFSSGTGCYIIINEGYHSYEFLDYAIEHYGIGLSFAEFVIPKGANYYESSNIYVSSQIIFKRICTTKEILATNPKQNV